MTAGGTTHAMGLDDWGAVFEPRLAVSLGQRVRPTIFSGWLYEVTEAGVLPAAEPEWWPIEGDNPSRQVGYGPSAGDALLPPAQPRALSCRGSMINASFGAPGRGRRRFRARRPLGGSAWCQPMRAAAGCGALADHWHGVAPVAGPCTGA
ncbi:hypothetical protein P4234_00140 [Pseudomonas aeruginosa]|nr:hypothetical protein [Pseudomonas aeruginosa]